MFSTNINFKYFIILFGILFAYFIVFPLVFNFFTSIAPQELRLLQILIAFKLCYKNIFRFWACFRSAHNYFLIVMLGISSTESLSKKRPYIIVFAFILGMILTPPDVISQILLALPIWLLFEFGLLLAKLFTKNKAKSNRG